MFDNIAPDRERDAAIFREVAPGGRPSFRCAMMEQHQL
ncbi:hypothetical protein Y717_35680 [Streptomyces scopuliridis RB72]|uniref:Uncharacterized protein n=1 Tax=Streptomyces scopuliridis RB72 TaxID=1440053 RepID=A0A2T7SRG8_9ACTN|nr:hypothetical protein Y717_35680 [Streptomyces scopuliridis RB72]